MHTIHVINRKDFNRMTASLQKVILDNDKLFYVCASCKTMKNVVVKCR